MGVKSGRRARPAGFAAQQWILPAPVELSMADHHDKLHDSDDQACASLPRVLQEPAPSPSEGPSKNAAKKAEKAAKKAAAKGGKGTSESAASASAAPTATIAKATAGPSLPCMYLSGDGPGPLKCLAAAKFFGVEVEAADVDPAGEGRTCSTAGATEVAIARKLKVVIQQATTSHFAPWATS